MCQCHIISSDHCCCFLLVKIKKIILPAQILLLTAYLPETNRMLMLGMKNTVFNLAYVLLITISKQVPNIKQISRNRYVSGSISINTSLCVEQHHEFTSKVQK